MITFSYIKGSLIGSIDNELFNTTTSREIVEKLFTLAEQYNSYPTEELKEEILSMLSPATRFIKEYDDWEIVDGQLYLKGTDKPVPGLLCDKIKAYLDNDEDVSAMKFFWESCLRNKRPEAIEELFEFLSKNYLSVTSDGGFIGKKKVTLKTGKIDERFEGFYIDSKGNVRNDKHQFVNSEESRSFKEYLRTLTFVASHDGKTSYVIDHWTWEDPSKCSYDNTELCGYGLHLGSDKYISWFSGDIVITCLTYPEYVTSVPLAESADKLRTYGLKTIGIASMKPLTDANYGY